MQNRIHSHRTLLTTYGRFQTSKPDFLWHTRVVRFATVQQRDRWVGVQRSERDSCYGRYRNAHELFVHGARAFASRLSVHDAPTVAKRDKVRGRESPTAAPFDHIGAHIRSICASSASSNRAVSYDSLPLCAYMVDIKTQQQLQQKLK